MQYKMDLSEFSFNKIKAGRRVDMRLFDKKRQSLKIGDMIEYENINNPHEHIDERVNGVRRRSVFCGKRRSRIKCAIDKAVSVDQYEFIHKISFSQLNFVDFL